MRKSLLTLALLASAASPALAQSTASAFTSAMRYDAMNRVTGTIAPDPDADGANFFATRNTYDAEGQLVKVEKGTLLTWQSEAVAPSGWSGFTVHETVDISYDVMGRKTKESLTGQASYGSNGPSGLLTLTQYSYDSLGRLECTAVRMNPAVFASLPASACTLGTQGQFGPDRITKNSYDAAGQLLKVTEAYGTSDQADEVTNSYTLSGKVETLTDAENNRSTWEYDGHDRLLRLRFSLPAKGALASSTTDYEQYGYDAAGNRTSLRNRAGETIFYGYDTLNRMTSKDLPNGGFFEYDISFAYDNRGLMLSAVQSNGHAVRYSYDNAGRVLSEGSDSFGAKTFLYDANGNRTRITHRDGVFFQYDHDGLDRVAAIRENGAASGGGVLASFTYDALGRRASLTRGNGTITSYSYDGASRLASLTQDLAGTANDLGLTFSHNPASQIVSNTRSNDAYAWTGHGSGSTASTANGLNQLASLGGATLAYDARGNLTSDGARSYGYTSENKLDSMNGLPALAYDGVGRAYYNALNGHWSDYDGDRLLAEIYHPTNAITRRYVHGPGVDEPLVWYEIGDTTPRRWLHADERGSIIAITNDAGSAIAINKYDEYGKPAANLGRFQYTGQRWISELGLADFDNRLYWPPGGRFLQTDPLGYKPGPNLYPYANNDPINLADPNGKNPVAIVAACARIPFCRTPVAGGIRWGARKIANAVGPLLSEDSGAKDNAKSPDISADDLTGKTKDELEQLAADKGLVKDPKRPDKYRDPVTGKERMRIDKGHVDKETGKPYDNPNAAQDHVHGYGPDGKTKVRDPSTDDAHFPIRKLEDD